MSYPVLEVLPELRQKLRDEPVVILQAPPGAGKSTVVPPHLVDEPWMMGKKIIMLEPRRLAARSVALRMADLKNEPAGRSIGYRVRFESRAGGETRIEVVTEGILTRMIQSDNALDGVGLIIFDEFHERSLQSDLALALTLQVQQVLRPDLRVLIMSATLETERISLLLKAPVVSSAGRVHPVAMHYIGVDDETPIWTRVARAVRKAYVEQPGDILAFLPGTGEIRRTALLLEEDALPVSLHPLFGDLSYAKQQEAILPHPRNTRKVVLATSIAETSLTIEGISTVIDSGFARVPCFDPRSGLTRLDTVRVSKDAAAQRAGRAGRTAPGVCYRLWSEGLHNKLVAHRSPEILEADLAPLVLELAMWGVNNIDDLVWITVPPAGALEQARNLLEGLGAIRDGVITSRGKEMARLPTHPRLAHLLLEGQSDAHTAALATDIAAMLEERDPLRGQPGADITLRIEALRRWRRGHETGAEKNALDRIERLASSWRKLLRIDPDNGNISDKEVGALIRQAYPERIARQVERHSERYKLMNGRVVRLPSHDPLLREPWLSVAELDAGAGEGRIFLAAPLDENDLLQDATERDHIYWDDDRGMVAGRTERRIGPLVLSTRVVRDIPPERATAVLLQVIREKGLIVLGWGDTFGEWQTRVTSLRSWRPEENWPDVSDESLLQRLDQWLLPFLDGITKQAELLRLDADYILKAMLSWDMNRSLDTLAPRRIQVPSGSQIKVAYFSDGRPPIMEVRLQEVFGLAETPTVNDGRINVIMHLLSPGYKPVQVTRDLRSFWSSTYADVRKELRTRYPRHSWPEDPWTAQPVRGARRRK